MKNYKKYCVTGQLDKLNEVGTGLSPRAQKFLKNTNNTKSISLDKDDKPATEQEKRELKKIVNQFVTDIIEFGKKFEESGNELKLTGKNIKDLIDNINDARVSLLGSELTQSAIKTLAQTNPILYLMYSALSPASDIGKAGVSAVKAAGNVAAATGNAAMAGLQAVKSVTQ